MSKDKMFTVLHIANLTDDKSKGPNINVPKNIIYGNKFANVGLYNLCGDKLAINIQNDKFFAVEKYNNIDNLPEPFNRPQIVVFQGVYFLKYCKIAKRLRKCNIPYIIVPRCSMTTAAIKSHALKKRVANFLFFNGFIGHACKIQFLTKNEYKESKSNFKFKDFYILGNGVDMPTIKYRPKNRNDFKIVFVGRYNIYHKGLDVLLDVVRDNKKWFRNNKVLLFLYGSDSDNGLGYLENRVLIDGLGDIVKICGPIFGKDKEKILLDADVFIHTSRLEGQPTSVIEAISYGIPVIVTPGTNVADIVLAEGLGFVADFKSESIIKCIKEAFENKKKYLTISKAEIEYARNNFDWERIIVDSLKNYRGDFQDVK